MIENIYSTDHGLKYGQLVIMPKSIAAYRFNRNVHIQESFSITFWLIGGNEITTDQISSDNEQKCRNQLDYLDAILKGARM